MNNKIAASLYLLLIAVSAFAAESFNQNYDFSKEKIGETGTPDAWNVKPADFASYSIENGHLIVKPQGFGAKCVTRRVPWNFQQPQSPRYMRIRLNNPKGKAHFFAGEKMLAPMFDIRDGSFTFPVNDLFGASIPGNAESLPFRLYVTDLLDVTEFQITDNTVPEGVYVTGSKPAGSTLTNGDTLTIRMPISGKADKLSLTLYMLNKSPKYGKNGLWVHLDWNCIPTKLTQGEDGIYSASFQLPEDRDFQCDDRRLVFCVNYLGSDSHSFGNYYGIVPFALDLKKVKDEPVSAASGDLRLYDFGPAGSPKHPLATETGLTWIRKPNRFAVGRAKAWDALTQDFAVIANGSNAVAEIALPDGKYHVVLGYGGVAWECYINWQFYPTSVTVTSGKEVLFVQQPDVRQRFLTLHKDARHTDDLYNDMIAPHFKCGEFDIEVRGGKYQMTFTASPQKNLALNYLAIYPQGSAECQATMEGLEETRRNNFNTYWKRLPDPVVQTVLRWKNEEPLEVYGRKNPYAYVYANSCPDPADIPDALNLFGAPDERISGVLMVRSGKGLKNLSLSLADIPGELFYNMRSHMVYTGRHTTWIAPNHLVPAGKRDLDAGTAYAYRYRYRIPADAKPGIFRGKIKFQWDGGSEEIPVTVRILPIRLPELADHMIALDMNAIHGSDTMLSNAMKFCREEAGCTTGHFRVGRTDWTQFQYDADKQPVDVIKLGQHKPEKLIKWLRCYKAADFVNKTPILMLAPVSHREAYKAASYMPFTPEYVKAMHLMYDKMVEICRKEGIPEFLLDTGGEMGDLYRKPVPKAVSDAIKVYQILRNKPGMKLMYRCNCDVTVESFFPYLDVMGVRGPDSWGVSDKITDHGKNKFIYSYSVSGRFLNGLHSWAHGAKGNLREWLYFQEGIENNNFLCTGVCGRVGHCEAIEGENETLCPTIRSEAFYESTIDRRYLRLLEEAIAKAPASPLRVQAEKYLAELRQRTLAWVTSFRERQHESDNLLQVTDGEAMKMLCARFAMALDAGQTTAEGFPVFEGASAKTSVIPEKPEPDVTGIPEEAKENFDDSKWAPIEIGKTWESQGYDYDGLAWYSVCFEASEELVNTAASIHFDAVDETAWCYLNGQYLGTHDGWDQAFDLPLKGLKKGKNRLAVLVRDINAAGGIWKPVSIQDKSGKIILELKENWRFYQDPAVRAIGEFRLDTGLMQFAGPAGLSGTIRVVPAAENTPNAVRGDLTLRHGDREIKFGREDLLKPEIRFHFPATDLKPGTEKILLHSHGEQIGEIHCYIIDR